MLAGNFFNYRFNDTELQAQFERWIDNNVPQLFSHFGKTDKNYTLGHSEVRSIVKGDGRYRKTLVELANMIQTMPAITNKTGKPSNYAEIHKSNIFLTIHLESNGHFQSLMRKVRTLLREVPSEEYRYNVVWYAEYLPRASTFD